LRRPAPAAPADDAPAYAPTRPVATTTAAQALFDDSYPDSNPSTMPVPISERLRSAGRQTWNFLKSPYFLKNFGVLLAFFLLLFLLINVVLNFYTHHGESLQVQDYRGMSFEEARRKARSRSFRLVVSDSVFRIDRAPNIVLEQDPKPFSRVKENRRIYLTISSSTAPKVLLPELEGAYNYDAYRRKLLRLGLQPTITERRFDSKLEANTILYFYYEGEKITEAELRRGVKAPKGSELQFVVTERLTDQALAPNLICLRYEEAAFLITSHDFVIGETFGAVADRNNAYVFLQEPEPGTMMRKGEQISVHLSQTKPTDCPTSPEPVDTTGELEEEFE
jgi:D-alanine-D-alanine ligase